MKLDSGGSPAVFDGIKKGQPFWHIRRAAWGIRMWETERGDSRPNAVLFWPSGTMDAQRVALNEPVVPAREVYIRIEQ